MSTNEQNLSLFQKFEQRFNNTEVELPDIDILSLFLRVVEKNRKTTALKLTSPCLNDKSYYSYSEIYHHVEYLTNSLYENGVREGDYVCVTSQSGFVITISLLALLRL